jgi:cupin fold WbuC family metalloprotein
MKLFGAMLLDELGARAAASPRRRAHYNVHADAGDLVQRFFVSMCRDSYIRPHRHRVRGELAMVLRGRFELLTFDEAGTVTGRQALGEGTASMGYELAPETWHMLIAETDGATFLEIKQGPYDPATAAQFADWAPSEAEPAAAGFLERARAVRPGGRP